MSYEAEQAVIANIITSDKVYDVAVEKLRADDFTDERMRLLFELVTKFRDKGRPTDTVTLAAACANSQRWVNTGADDPLQFIGALADLTRAYQAVNEYIRMIKTASVARLLLDYCTEVYSLTHDNDLDGDEMLAKAHQLLPTLENTGGVVTYKEAAKQAVESLNRRFEGELLGVSTGFSHLDDMILGWEPGTLNILAGRPSHGKSLYAMDFAHAASQSGPVFVYSLEMTTANVALRGLASLGKADFGRLRSGKMSEQDWPRVTGAAITMKDMPIYIDDRGGLGVEQLCSRARAMARRNKPVLIVVDYLQLLAGKGDNRTAQIGNVSRSLKALAKELNVPVIALSQLNRAVDSRPDKRPLMSDLRESGEIEQDADVILFTYLHEKYEEDTPRKGIGELICRKQRNGETGTLYTEFEGVHQRFIERKDPSLPPMSAEKEKPERTGRGMSSFVGSPNAAINDERKY